MNREAIFQALTIAALLGLVKFIRDVVILQTKVDPLLEWWRKTSIDALKIATNPTSEQLTKLAERYIASVKGDKSKEPLSVQEKQELIDGLREVMNNPGEYASKRQSASMSLRFIETREGLSSTTH